MGFVIDNLSFGSLLDFYIIYKMIIGFKFFQFSF